MYYLLKRSFDIAFSLIGLIILSPIIFLTIIFIKLSSPGPILFRQKRVGKNKKIFIIFKFRTMKNEDRKGGFVTLKNDKRITPVGSVLRKYKIDEIPQLINVLLGDMSFVGPRPEIPELVSTYKSEYHKLFSVKPGITSPAAIFYRDEEEIVGSKEELFEYHKTVLIPKKASFDLAYIAKQSFLYDIKLVLLTILSVVTNISGYVRDSGRKQRRLIIIVISLFLCVLSYYIAYLIRFDLMLNNSWNWLGKFLRTAPLIIMMKISLMAFYGLFEGYWRYVGIKDLFNITKVIVGAAVGMLLIEHFFLDPEFPTGVIPIDAFLSFILLSGQRLSMRLLREIYSPIRPHCQENALLIGAGDRGEAVLREIKRNTDLALNIIGFIGSANEKGIKIHQTPVLGEIEDIFEIIENNNVNTIIIAKEDLAQRETGILIQAKGRFHCKIMNVPNVSDYITGKVVSSRYGEVKIEDLLGRKSVKLNAELIEHIYKDKRVLVTGAGGSIGSELVRHLVRFAPSELLLLDKDETLLFEIQNELKEKDAAVNCRALIGDINNSDRMRTFFSKFKPEIVIHAAAYKHVPLLEIHCHDALVNNVFGTHCILSIAHEYNVERFVMISTDKAVRPTNVMGASKLLAERIMFESIAPNSNMRCMAVRFGNVLSSRGSVIPLFKKQIERGGPVLITHPEVQRYFMSIPEAAQLVLQAGAMGEGGDLFILKMGNPVKIKDLAYKLIEFSGLRPQIDIPIKYIGLRPGEKLKEELLTEIEGTMSTEHKKIFVIEKKSQFNAEIMQKLENVKEQIYSFSNSQVRGLLKEIVPEYMPNKRTDPV
ncbi:MAG: NAD-dependent epimerase/dehydratase family protein [Chitinivibrionales bacterium]|nr:NAD-dependent epimerase/dehydratase family protein [Chitinivibrionales bacterium]